VFDVYFDLVVYIVVISILPVLTVNVQSWHIEDPPEVSPSRSKQHLFSNLGVHFENGWSDFHVKQPAAAPKLLRTVLLYYRQ
jgi:hypothetical protein